MGVDILFVIPPFHLRNGGGSFFPLGIGYIISQVEAAGYTWEVLNLSEHICSLRDSELNKIPQILKCQLEKIKPLLIGVGPCVTTQLRALKTIAKACREVCPSIPVFAGGPLATIEDQDWLFYEELGIEFLIKGDGEFAVVDAIHKVKEGYGISKSPFVSHVGYSYVNHINDIDQLLFPYRDFNGLSHFSIRRAGESKKQAAMVASRGCPYACKYCVSGNLSHGDMRYRKRSTENILNEIRMLIDNFNVNDIVFYDDCFFSNSKTVNADIADFCNALASNEIQVTWQIEMRPDIFVELSDESIRRLNDTGCRQINLGIEKVSSRGLSFLGKKDCLTDLKVKIWNLKCMSSIAISATFILGGDNENEEDVRRLIKESQDLHLDFAHYNPLFLYPGTPLYYDVYNDRRRWASIIFEDDLPWGEIVYENEFLSRDKLIHLVDYAYSEFYKNTPYAEEQMISDRFNIKGE